MTVRAHLRLALIALSPTAFMFEMMRLNIELYNSALMAAVGAGKKQC